MRRGFTLIELLVVIAIIGMLTSVIIASLSSARVKSRDSRRIADLKQVQIALELYYDEMGEFPSPGAGNASNASIAFTNMAETLKSAGYIPSIAVDPINDTNHKYLYVPLKSSSATKCKSYHMGATLESISGDASYLNSDSDAVTAGTSICKASPVNNFNGTGAPCGTNTTSALDTCYDLTP